MSKEQEETGARLHGAASDLGGMLGSEEAARLIKADPELLEAARLALKDLEHWPGQENPEFFRSVKALREAIAKAEGQEGP